jgi:hypothetical protein
MQPLLPEAKAKPRLTRQSAIAELADDSSHGSSRGLLVRCLETIPSAAESTEVGGATFDVAASTSQQHNKSSQLDPSHEESIPEDSNA